MQAPSAAALVRCERRGAVGILTIDRPERRNALNLQVKQEIVEGLARLEQDAQVAAIVLTGAGGCFVAGTDIAEMADMRPTDHVRLATDHVFHAIRRASKPVIARLMVLAPAGRRLSSARANPEATAIQSATRNRWREGTRKRA